MAYCSVMLMDSSMVPNLGRLMALVMVQTMVTKKAILSAHPLD